jgi:hypothetical protein
MADKVWEIQSNVSLGELAYEGDAIVTASLIWEAVDSGIGDYEYWGAKGNDSQTSMELEDVIIEEAFFYTEDGNEEPIDLKNPANKPLIDYWVNYIFEFAEYD